jgi:membrane-bound lytic murein transglycosylase F
MVNLKSIFWTTRTAIIAGTFAVLLILNQLVQHETVLSDWRNGELVVLISDTGADADTQFEQDLAQLFAEQLHTTLRIISADTTKIPALLAQHQAHFAAAGLRTNETITGIKFGPIYQTVHEHLVFDRARAMPTRITDLLNKRIAVVAGSAQESMLREAQRNLPSMQWQARTHTSVENLLDEVANGSLDYTIVNQEQLALAQNFNSNLAAADLTLGLPSQLAWGFPADADAELTKAAESFFETLRDEGTLDQLLDRYYGYNERLEPMDAAAFITHIKTTLPHYRAMFEEAAHSTGLEWQLIAAVAYQESHWNPLATSPTNVRGMMMLTENTADQMNVGNRLDARESILAGAQYLALIRDQLPQRIDEPDRTMMALAAYNQGTGHLEDARILTQRMGMNADRWLDVKQWMPMLSRPSYFKHLKHRYARGGEAVILVENIRMYYDMLKRVDDEINASRTPFTLYYQLFGSEKKNALHDSSPHSGNLNL